MKTASRTAILALLAIPGSANTGKACNDNSATCEGDEVTLYQMRIASQGGKACGSAPNLDGQAVDSLISAASSGVLVVGDPNKLCTKAAVDTLNNKGESFTMKNLNNLDFKYSKGANQVWDWLHCTYPNDSHGGNIMHSYVFRDGQFIGEGFHAAQLLQGNAASGSGSSGSSGDCDADYPGAKAVVDGYKGKAENKVLLFGWLGCPCTGIAQSRFATKSLCYDGRQWADGNSDMMKYLQCKEQNTQHHSFIYFRDSAGAWQFNGNGFDFDEKAKSDADLDQLIAGSGAKTTCKQANIKTNIFGSQLEECRSDLGDSSGSWMDDGTCSEQTGGIHQICIEQLPADFSSETHQSAWSEGRKDKRHCVCIGAWSLYMTDANNHADGASAITPHCKAISETSMTKRYLENWKDWNGFAANVVVGIKELVGRCIGQGNAQEKCELKKRFDKVVSEIKELQDDSELDGVKATMNALSC